MVAPISSNIFSSTDVATTLFDNLFSEDRNILLQSLIALKESLIGSNKMKQRVLSEVRILPRLLTLLKSCHYSTQLKEETTYVLGSLARDSQFLSSPLFSSLRFQSSKAILDNLLGDSKMIRSSLSALVALRPQILELESRPSVLNNLLALLPNYPLFVSQLLSVSITRIEDEGEEETQSQSKKNEIGASILGALSPSTLTTLLSNSSGFGPTVTLSLLTLLSSLLESSWKSVSRRHHRRSFSSRCSSEFTSLVPSKIKHVLESLFLFSNISSSSSRTRTSSSQGSLLELVSYFVLRGKEPEIQLKASSIIAYLLRFECLAENDNVVVYQALPCLIRLIKDIQTRNRISAAKALSLLLEKSGELQRIASFSNHLLSSLQSSFFDEGRQNVASSSSNNNGKQEVNTDGRQLREAAYKLIASLSYTDETLRKKIIIFVPDLMTFLVSDLESFVLSSFSPICISLCKSALSTLHSLSRSVTLLRTIFKDSSIEKFLLVICNSNSNKFFKSKTSSISLLKDSSSSCSSSLTLLSSSILINLLLEFSPSKDSILKSGGLELFVSLSQREVKNLRLNGVWGLMNMAFQANQQIKVQIINSLGSDQIFRLLSDKDDQVVMKTLGLLRNLLSNKTHIDNVMALYGKQIMQSVVFILESDNGPDVKEQALCILGNIGDGEKSKERIMSNEDVLKKLSFYLRHLNGKLQIAAVCAVQNLIWRSEEGFFERQKSLREIGVYKTLQSLLISNSESSSSSDSLLLEKVKGALNQFT